MVQIYIKSPELVEQIIDGETVVLDKAAGLIHQLNATASTIWKACDGKTSSGDIAAQIAEQYDISLESASVDVDRTLQQLEQQKLVQPVEH